MQAIPCSSGTERSRRDRSRQQVKHQYHQLLWLRPRLLGRQAPSPSSQTSSKAGHWHCVSRRVTASRPPCAGQWLRRSLCRWHGGGPPVPHQDPWYSMVSLCILEPNFVDPPVANVGDFLRLKRKRRAIALDPRAGLGVRNGTKAAAASGRSTTCSRQNVGGRKFPGQLSC